MLLLGTALTLGACGHSESEWQAQLAKYEKLSQKHDASEKELAELQKKVDELRTELEAMGFKLGEEGAAKEKLLSALEEYKERAAALERIKERFDSLRAKLEELTKLGLKIDIRNNRMVISLPGDVLFASGKDELEEKGIEILAKVAKVIREDDELVSRTYQVAGHTDNQPIKSVRTKKAFKDNWGLSLMRARTVLLFLVHPADDEKEPGGGLTPGLWSASGYGDTDPIASNAGKVGRQKNRRVELIMMPNVEEMLDLKSLMAEPDAEKGADKPKEAPTEEKKGDAKPAPAEAPAKKSTEAAVPPPPAPAG